MKEKIFLKAFLIEFDLLIRNFIFHRILIKKIDNYILLQLTIYLY